MKKTTEVQIYDFLKQASSVLVALPAHPSTDAVTAGLALLTIIEKLGKRGRVVCSNFQLPEQYGFLPKSKEIFDDLTTLRKFIIHVDTSKTSVEELSYTIEDNHLNIYLSPKDGFLKADDVTTEAGDYSYDLIVTVGCQELEQIGPIYENNADFFFQTPIINIDHNAANDHFGQVNLVQVTATSTSEIIFELIKDWEEGLLDEFLATNLLTGMISKTRSFKTGTVTPRSLAIASHLISQGARRDEIVRHLYQSKRLSTLKLWGRALSQLEADTERKIVWSRLSAQDFKQTGAVEDDLRDVIDELIINTPEAKNIFLLYPSSDGTVHCIMSTAPYIKAMELFSAFTPTGNENFTHITVTDQTPEQVEEMVLERLTQSVDATQ